MTSGTPVRLDAETVPLTLAPGQRLCDDGVVLDTDSERAQLTVLRVDGPGGHLHVTATSSGYRSTGSVALAPQEAGVRPIEVPLAAPRAAVIGQVCLTTSGAGALQLAGTVNARALTRSHGTLDGVPQPQAFSLTLLEAHERAPLARIGQFATRAAALSPRGSVAVLDAAAAAAAGCAGACGRSALTRTARRRLMRVCLIYDCLFPHTVGGAERWYRSLGERLAAEGHDVTYLTLRQWDRGVDPGLDDVAVRIVGPRMALYDADGKRRILPPLVFGLGVLRHLLVHGRRYDVVHTASFPYFSLLAAAFVRPLHRFGLIVDWHEVWTRAYWDEYLGRLGRVGHAVQRRCLRVPQRAFCFARMTATRLRDEGLRGEPTVLTGEYAGALERPQPAAAEPIVAFAGRHIPEKRVPALVRAFARAHAQAPELRLVVLGDGPERPAVLEAIAEQRLEDVASAPGFVDAEEVERTLARSLCMVLPSRREGYGMVVVEAAARGVPSVVVHDPDNAAVELVDDGENGFIAASAEPEELAQAILRVHAAGPPLRETTADWFARNAQRLSLSGSLDRVAEAYRDERPVGAGDRGGGVGPYTSRA